MSEQPIIEIFKTKVSWDLDAYHWRNTDSIYVAKESTSSNRYVTDDISTLPKNLLSFYKPGTKIKLLDSEKRVTLDSLGNTYLQVVNEPLSNDELSDLVTAFADEIHLYPRGCCLSNRKVAEVEIFNTKAVYHLQPDQVKETDSCFVLKELGNDSYHCAYDDIAQLARGIPFYFAPGTKVIIPRWSPHIINHSYIDPSTILRIVHEPLVHEELSDLLSGFASELHYLKNKKKEYNKPSYTQKPKSSKE